MPTDRHLGIGHEVAFGSQVAITKFLRIENETLKEEDAYYHHETVAYDSPEDSYVVDRTVKGGIKMVPCPDEIGELLFAFFGQYSYATAGTADTHTFDNGSSAEAPFLTIAVQRDTSGKADYVGCKVDSFELSAEQGGPLVTNWDIMGKEQAAVAGGGSAPTFMVDHPYLMNTGVFKLNGDTYTTIKAISIKFSNNYDDKGDKAIGTASMSDLRRQMIKIEGSVTLTKPDTALYGTSYRQGASGAIHVTFHAKTSGGTTRPLIVTVPKVHWTDASEGNIDKRDLNEAEYKFEGNYSVGSAYTGQIILENNHGTSYPN